MSLKQETFSRKPIFIDLKDSSLSKNEKDLFDDDYYNKQIKKLNSKQKESIRNNDKRLIKKDLAHADYIERLILESGLSSNEFLDAAPTKQRRRSSNFSNNSHHIDKLLQDENNDWFFEKILEKFEDIRTRKTNDYTRSEPNEFYNNAPYGVERIIERRYYVKKPRFVPKRDQLTSTSDLTGSGEKKYRQLSGLSSATEATSCSGCSSSPPTYVENLREQSDSLRNEISDLKSEIENLQTSQQHFFQQFRTYFQSKPTASSNLSPSAVSPNKPSAPLFNNRSNRPDSSQSESSSGETATSGTSSPIRNNTIKPIAASSNTSIPAAPRISEFMANKNPAINSRPPINTSINSKPPSVVPTIASTSYTASRSSINTTGPRMVAPPGSVSSSSSSVAPTPQNTAFTAPRNAFNTTGQRMVGPGGSVSSIPSSIAPTPQNSAFTASRTSLNTSGQRMAAPEGSVSSRSSSVAPTPQNTSFTAPRNGLNTSGQRMVGPGGSVSSIPTSIAPISQNSAFTASRTSLNTTGPRMVGPAGSVNSIPSSTAPTPPAAPPIGRMGSQTSFGGSSIPLAPPIGPMGSQTSSAGPSSIPMAPPMGLMGSRTSAGPSSIPMAPPIGLMGSRTSSGSPTSSIDTSKPAGRIPTLGNEIAHRRILSPRSQIVASSASLQESSDSSSESISGDFVPSTPRQISKAPLTTLRDNDMKALTQYSSQLELSGFAPSINPVITDPNNNSTFWDSVDHYIDNSRPTNVYSQLPSTSQTTNINHFGLDNTTTKQLDKYDLEIKSQGYIGSSAPFLMPPLDSLP